MDPCVRNSGFCGSIVASQSSRSSDFVSIRLNCLESRRLRRDLWCFPSAKLLTNQKLGNCRVQRATGRRCVYKETRGERNRNKICKRLRDSLLRDSLIQMWSRRATESVKKCNDPVPNCIQNWKKSCTSKQRAKSIMLPLKVQANKVQQTYPVLSATTRHLLWSY